MIIRKAENEDIPQIVDLLKQSLGESLLEKSEKFWKWKHLDNPFGPSPVLVMEENKQLLGVRAFLKWKFTDSGKQIKAGRAVDTAIHPSFQGKGIFTRLTQQLLEQVTQDGWALIYNSPNKQSLPGYLKMGWETWGKLPIQIKPILFPKKAQQQEAQDWEQCSTLITKLEQGASKPKPGIHTLLAPGYIRWRYEECPLITYSFITDGFSYLLLYRLKEGSKGTEFRIVDFFGTEDLKRSEMQQLQDRLKMRIQKSGCRWVSISGLYQNSFASLSQGWLPALPIGPQVTLRNLNLNSPPSDLPWEWSLGDLELF